MSDRTYIYGYNNGQSYRPIEGEDSSGALRTHWDARVEVSTPAHMVQIGVVPPSSESTSEQGLWDTDDGQFLALDRDGCNRLIRSIREARDAAYGRDE